MLCISSNNEEDKANDSVMTVCQKYLDIENRSKKAKLLPVKSHNFVDLRKTAKTVYLKEKDLFLTLTKETNYGVDIEFLSNDSAILMEYVSLIVKKFD